MARFQIVVIEPSEDEEGATREMGVVADSMEQDETGSLAFWQGTTGSERLVAVFAPGVWLWAEEKARTRGPE